MSDPFEFAKRYRNEIGFTLNGLSLEELILKDFVTDYRVEDNGDVTIVTRQYGLSTFTLISK